MPLKICLLWTFCGLPGAEYNEKIAKTKFHNSILRAKTQEIFRASGIATGSAYRITVALRPELCYSVL
jgi:hypothetical protein